MSPEKLADIKLAIQELRNKSTFADEGRRQGCCHVVSKFCNWDYSDNTLPTHQELQDFPGYSGDPGFPVSHPNIACPAMAYFQDGKWGDNEYGYNRRVYALWLANFLETKFFPNQLY